MSKRTEDVVEALAKGAERNYQEDGYILPVLAIDVIGGKSKKEQTIYMPIMPGAFKDADAKKKFLYQCGYAVQLMMNEGRVNNVNGVYVVAPADVTIINSKTNEEEKSHCVIITGLEPDGDFSVRGFTVQENKLNEDKRLTMEKNTETEGENYLLEEFYKGLLTIQYNE